MTETERLGGEGAAWPRRRIQTTVDAQGRGRADDIDPADQWVLNPNTGEYELRLSPSTPQSSVPGPRRPPSPDADTPARGRTRRPAARSPRRPAVRCRRSAGAAGRRRSRRRGGVDGGRRRRAAKGKKVLLWTGGVMAFVLVAGGGRRVPLHRAPERQHPSVSDDGASTGGFQKDKAINILLIGTDKRTGAGNEKLRRRGQRRPRRHHDPAARLQGPLERDRAEHPA